MERLVASITGSRSEKCQHSYIKAVAMHNLRMANTLFFSRKVCAKYKRKRRSTVAQTTGLSSESKPLNANQVRSLNGFTHLNFGTS